MLTSHDRLPPSVTSTSIFSTREALHEISDSLQTYTRLTFAGDAIPGRVAEHVIASVKGGKVLRTYDFVDVICREEQIGWQVKSSIETTPVTWKRAKIPDAQEMIAQSERDQVALQHLGDAILGFCNAHGRESLRKYGLTNVGYARIIIHKNKTATYFERELINTKTPNVFDPADFIWEWSKQKKTRTKEQLSALHGIHRPSGKKWFAWHGRGENQLHFSGEPSWWPQPNDPHAIRFSFSDSSSKVDLPTLARLLDEYDQRHQKPLWLYE